MERVGHALIHVLVSEEHIAERVPRHRRIDIEVVSPIVKVELTDVHMQNPTRTTHDAHRNPVSTHERRSNNGLVDLQAEV